MILISLRTVKSEPNSWLSSSSRLPQDLKCWTASTRVSKNIRSINKLASSAATRNHGLATIEQAHQSIEHSLQDMIA